LVRAQPRHVVDGRHAPAAVDRLIRGLHCRPQQLEASALSPSTAETRLELASPRLDHSYVIAVLCGDFPLRRRSSPGAAGRKVVDHCAMVIPIDVSDEVQGGAIDRYAIGVCGFSGRGRSEQEGAWKLIGRRGGD